MFASIAFIKKAQFVDVITKFAIFKGQFINEITKQPSNIK